MKNDLLEKIEVEDFLNELGLRNVREDGNEVNFSCPFPNHKNGDANPSASMQKGSTVFHCFGCQESGNAVSFLARLEGVSPLQALQWIRERFGDGFKEPETSLLDEVNQIFNNKPHLDVPHIHPILSEKEIEKRYIDWTLAGLGSEGSHHYLLNRGFTPNTLEEWEIGYDLISQRYSIPIRDVHKNLIGFKGRTGNPDLQPRYLVLGGSEYGFEPYETASVVFGLYKVEDKSTLILIEGELNTIAMWQHGYDNAVGISGKYLSVAQVNLLKQYCDKILLFFDEIDDAIRAARKLEPYMSVFIVPEHNDDPAGLPVSIVDSLVMRATSSLLL